MNDDDEVLDAMKQALADVRMDRPVEAIEQRGRKRRRNRALFTAAGGGLAAVAAVALALPMAIQQPAPAPAASAEGSLPAIEQVAFTVEKLPDSRVRLTVRGNYGDPAPLQKALTDAGVPATFRTGVYCAPKDGRELPQADKVYSYQTHVVDRDMRKMFYTFTISTAAIPADGRLVITSFSRAPGLSHVQIYLVANDDPMKCLTEADFKEWPFKWVEESELN